MGGRHLTRIQRDRDGDEMAMTSGAASVARWQPVFS
jgi:hypothetical protein